ncbi:hypothetical protein BWQ96_09765 [Gracilariopsis chorda]|uniref:Uncharacterized protein n=1 Tax=Gracilariopsis chorda TaxID=448386 RepID=A0A2V3IET3_9FLOR|nr:hypothetical protein BWQ96_09765 [Gracilariopsis chorda]|eukprot:PXF40528.1 hypothetical protein BWQ96_09765 [Gracilariopsis chorda]
MTSCDDLEVTSWPGVRDTARSNTRDRRQKLNIDFSFGAAIGNRIAPADINPVGKASPLAKAEAIRFGYKSASLVANA